MQNFDTEAFSVSTTYREESGNRLSLRLNIRKTSVFFFCQAQLQLQLKLQLKLRLALFPFDPATHPSESLF